MSVFSASEGYPFRSYATHSPQPTQSPAAWGRQRGPDRISRRLAAAGHRAKSQLGQLAHSWRVVEWPHPGPNSPGRERAGFLVIGPGGVYSVTIVDQGRQRVMLAGDVVQIQGRRPPHIADARRDARRASAALTSAVGATVPVVPVLTFVGSGALSVHGPPADCLVSSHRDLDRLLLAAGDKISIGTARKLADVASHPDIWADHRSQGTRTAGDKPGTHR